ncbi:MAG: hypothetical protein IKZ60_01385 [Bacteroidales bacterium]|nr:hypothetical protein [Bacteroidales bacterium]
MVENDFIDLKKLNLDELNGVVNLYPWFGGARKELCRRMSELGEGAWSDERYADAALYIGSRRIISQLAHKGHKADYSDHQVKELLRAYIDEGVGEIKDEGAPRRVIVVGGDYFSAQQYATVKKEGDTDFAAMARDTSTSSLPAGPAISAAEFTDFCTETLAQIYADQGYPDQAIQIYSRLSLRFPEKSAYFAALIEKLKN